MPDESVEKTSFFKNRLLWIITALFLAIFLIYLFQASIEFGEKECGDNLRVIYAFKKDTCVFMMFLKSNFLNTKNYNSVEINRNKLTGVWQSDNDAYTLKVDIAIGKITGGGPKGTVIFNNVTKNLHEGSVFYLNDQKEIIQYKYHFIGSPEHISKSQLLPTF